MKKILFFIFLFAGIQTNAQTVTPLIETSGPCGGLTLSGNDLYVVSAFNEEIYKIDVTIENPETEIISIDSNGLQQGICTYGDYLCVAWSNQGKVVRLNLSQENITPEEIVAIEHPNGIAVHNSDLYISSDNSIFKVDLNSGAFSIEEILSDLDVSGFVSGTIGIKVYGDYLYLAENDGIYKVNLNSLPYSKELVTQTTGVSFCKADENTLYVVEQSFPGKIHEVNINSQESSILIEMEGFEYPTLLDIVHFENSLFVSCLEGLKVARIDLETLNVEEVIFPAISLFPNPAHSFLELSNVEIIEKVTIINSLGQKIENVIISNNKIDISQLTPGIYFAAINGKSYKFIKN